MANRQLKENNNFSEDQESASAHLSKRVKFSILDAPIDHQNNTPGQTQISCNIKDEKALSASKEVPALATSSSQLMSRQDRTSTFTPSAIRDDCSATSSLNFVPPPSLLFMPILQSPFLLDSSKIMTDIFYRSSAETRKTEFLPHPSQHSHSNLVNPTRNKPHTDNSSSTDLIQEDNSSSRYNSKGSASANTSALFISNAGFNDPVENSGGKCHTRHLIDLKLLNDDDTSIVKSSLYTSPPSSPMKLFHKIANLSQMPKKDPAEFCLVSYNIGSQFNDNQDKSPKKHHKWKGSRDNYVTKVLGLSNADIMCLQELTIAQSADLLKAFGANYHSVFLAQTPTKNGHPKVGDIAFDLQVETWETPHLGTPMVGIFVKNNLKIIASGRFWLNESPDKVPENTDRGETDKGFGNMNTYRATLWVKVESAPGKISYIFNSHYPLNGNNYTRYKCAETEMEQIKKITNGASWVSAGDRNLIPGQMDKTGYSLEDIYQVFIKAKGQDSRYAQTHHGPSATWIGFTGNYPTQISAQDRSSPITNEEQIKVFDLIFSSKLAKKSFIEPGAFDPITSSIIGLDQTEALKVANEHRYFASDHALIGAIFDNHEIFM